MQYEAKHRPVQKRTGPVTGFPSQQRNRQPQPPDSRLAPSQRTIPPSATPQQSTTGFVPPTKQPISRSQPAGNRQIGYKGTPATRNNAVPLNRQPPVASKPNNRNRESDNRVMPRRASFSFAPPATQATVSPVFRQTTFNTAYTPTPTVAIVNPAPGYQPPYIFKPEPDTQPVPLPDNSGNSLSDTGKAPDDMPVKQPCTCGQTGNGCTVLNKFATGRAELTEKHRKQLTVLANTIIKQQVEFVTITGHTDAAGTEENNEVLGIKRANAVERELKNTIHQQEPRAETNIFFKTRTSGESEPVSATQDELNRRVAVCLK